MNYGFCDGLGCDVTTETYMYQIHIRRRRHWRTITLHIPLSGRKRFYGWLPILDRPGGMNRQNVTAMLLVSTVGSLHGI